MMPTAKFLASGRVQGVFYRASARKQALALGICGYAKNQPDGSVEVLASGSVLALDTLERWLRKGPPMAAVEMVSREDVPELELTGFRIG